MGGNNMPDAGEEGERITFPMAVFLKRSAGEEGRGPGTSISTIKRQTSRVLRWESRGWEKSSSALRYGKAPWSGRGKRCRKSDRKVLLLRKDRSSRWMRWDPCWNQGMIVFGWYPSRWYEYLLKSLGSGSVFIVDAGIENFRPGSLSGTDPV